MRVRNDGQSRRLRRVEWEQRQESVRRVASKKKLLASEASFSFALQPRTSDSRFSNFQIAHEPNCVSFVCLSSSICCKWKPRVCVGTADQIRAPVVFLFLSSLHSQRHSGWLLLRKPSGCKNNNSGASGHDFGRSLVHFGAFQLRLWEP